MSDKLKPFVIHGSDDDDSLGKSEYIPGYSEDEANEWFKKTPTKPEELNKAEECEHDDVDEDDRCCLDCGKDMTEELACKAEYYRDMMEDR